MSQMILSKLKERILQAIGIEYRSPFVRDYFYIENMRSAIYATGITVVLEIWMIIRLTRTLIIGPMEHEFSYFFKRYYINYFILLTAASMLLVFAIRYTRGKTRRKRVGKMLIFLYTSVCIYFGIVVSINDYGKGEQILTFLTMELFVLCLLTWRPIEGFFILTVSYVYFFWRLSNLAAPNTGKVGLTLASQINGFVMWLSTLVFCIMSYNKTRSQALKDENLLKINSHLSEISVTDELTGIHNMVYFRTEAEKMMSFASSDRDTSLCLFLDIENFKFFNETYGFLAGNELLTKIAKCIESSFKGSLVARFSDDHFVVLTGTDHIQDSLNMVTEELKKLEREVSLEMKCGAYQLPEEGASPGIACDRARFACNSIKKHYDRSLRYYDKELEQQFQLKQYIVNNIDNAIENGYIKVYYQPVVSTETGEVCGLEALARWQDPNHGLLSPGAFITVLEEYRQIHKLDRYIIDQVCRDYRESVESGEPFVPVSVNFSRLDFELCDIVGYLSEKVAEYQVPKSFMDVEITESALSDQKDFLPNAICALRSSGFLVWLDDFGSGYSSLNVLKDFHFDVLKIDMKFLSGFGTNDKILPILKNIITLAQQLDMVSLTEGVETQEQYDFLCSIGCGRAQGYLFGKPMPLADIRKRVHDGKLRMMKIQTQ